MSQTVNMRLYLVMVAQMVASQTGVELVFSDSATTASTNGKRLIIPTRFGSEATEDHLTVIRGLIAHEGVGHIRHTDFEAWGAFAKRKDLPAIKMHLLNVIEDPRIEKAAIKIFPGVRSMLSSMVDFIQKVKPEFFNHTGSEPIPAASAVSGMLLNRLRRDELGQNCDPEPFIKACHDYFGEALTEKLYQMGLQGSRAQSTSGAILATEGILAILKEEADKNPSDDKEEQSESSEGEGESGGERGQAEGQPKDGEGEGDGAESDKPAEGKPGKGKGKGKGKSKSDKASAKEDKSAKEQASKTKAAAQSAIDDAGNGKIGRDLNEVIEELVQEISQNASPYSEVPYSFNKVVTVKGLNPNLNLNVSQRGGAIRVAASLEELLQAKVDEREVLSRSGRLVGRLLAKTKVLNLQVFEQEAEETTGLSTAVWFMIDASGSMQDAKRGEIANEAIIVSGEALCKFDVPFGISYFNDKVTDAKQFGETWQTIKGRFQHVMASGGTPITAAMIHANGKLMSRPEERKVAMIVTDGTYNVDWKPYLDSAKLAGVEMRFVVVGHDKAYQKTIDDLRSAGAVVSQAKASSDIAVAILDSLKQVF